MIKDEFDPQSGDWFRNKKVWIDLGYLGFDNDFQTDELHVPHKSKRRKKETDPRIVYTDEEEADNKVVSSKRIYVEHAIGGIKRYRFFLFGSDVEMLSFTRP